MKRYLFLLAIVLGSLNLSAQTITYSESFTGGVIYDSSSSQWINWTNFIAQLTPRPYSSVTIKGSNDATGVSVTDGTVATAIANALYTRTAGSWTTGGRTWAVGICGYGWELSASGSVCSCPNPGFIVRPHIGNYNWGGVNNPTCNAGSQILTVVFNYSIFTFTTAGLSGRTGPSQAQVNSAYTGTSLAGGVTVNTTGIQEWTVPSTGNYKIEAYGAQGGNSYSNYRTGGLGAYINGEFSLTAGQVLKVLVGQTASNYAGTTQYEGGGGGGGSFVWKSTGNELLVAAGGGGGGGANQGTAYNGNAGTTTTSGTDSNGQFVSSGGTSGNGGGENTGTGGYKHGGSAGGGWLSDGASVLSDAEGGFSILYGNGVGGRNGSIGTQSNYGSDGGFGGGGGAVIGGGGGGGYSGGGAGNQPSSGGWIENGGGGGGSYNIGINTSSTAGSRSGNGVVIISSVYYAVPTITSFTPTSADNGTTVTITGTNLTGASAVSFGGTAATSFNVVSATSVTAVVGTGASGSVSITTPGGTATLSGFTWVSSAPANPTSVTPSANPICNSFSTTLTANGAVGTVYWYTGSCGGTQVGTGNTLTVSPSSNTTYSARNYNNGQYSAGCASVTITVNQPSFTPADQTVASLQATGTAIKWYSSSSGGTALTSSTQLVNGNHYYASQTVNGQESTSRFNVTTTLDLTPCKPTCSSAQTYSSGSTVANLQATGSSIRWYSASSGGSALSPSTVLINGTHYWASQTVNCTESATRFEVVVTLTF